MKNRQLDEVVDVCSMLADLTRASIIASLARGPKSVGELCRQLTTAQPTVSHHLALLRMARLVLRQRQGKQMIYALDADRLKPLEKFLAGLR